MERWRLRRQRFRFYCRFWCFGGVCSAAIGPCIVAFRRLVCVVLLVARRDDVGRRVSFTLLFCAVLAKFPNVAGEGLWCCWSYSVCCCIPVGRRQHRSLASCCILVMPGEPTVRRTVKVLRFFFTFASLLCFRSRRPRVFWRDKL